MKDKNTKLWMRVLFVITLLSLSGIIWQQQRNIAQHVKIEGSSFTEGIVGTPRFINPVLAQSESDKDLTKLVFGSLISKNKDGYNYDLSESLEISDDKKKYTLTLRDNLYFHDGTKITIDDVIFTIEKIQDPMIKSPLGTKWEGVKTEKLNRNQVVFTLNQEYSDFVQNLSLGILPKHLWSNIKSEEFILSIYNNKPIGSGDYEVKNIKYKETGIPEYYTLEKTKHSDAYISTIKLSFYENEIELAKAFRNKDIQAAYGLSANKNNRDLFNSNSELTGKLPRVFGLFLNQNKQSILKDKNVRGLINTAINRDALIDTLFQDYAYPITTATGENKEFTQEIDTYIKNIEKSGWKKNKKGFYTKSNGDDEKILSIDISTVNIQELTDVAHYIKDELSKHGIQINVRTFDEGNLHQKVIRTRDYEMLLFGYMIEKETDLYAFWHSSQKNDPGLNISLYNNSKVDKELEKLRKDKETADLSIIEDEINKDIPAIFLYSPAYTYLLPEKIKGEENMLIINRQDRFSDIENWYVYTRKVWDIFISNKGE
ncbi:MAG: ABC transporter substrate-binding protein [Candidatus Pacebacteria bacterium]|nr:ABC transporter substrate-binding protein [Candidatus Paceibacterota bacterium]